MYDEFGNLKKKFRAKTQQVESRQMLPGSGRAGWEVEELGTVSLSLNNLKFKFDFGFFYWQAIKRGILICMS